jgi:alpha-galactosidase/6-phospho-beta-glucosidase family protein
MHNSKGDKMTNYSMLEPIIQGRIKDLKRSNITLISIGNSADMARGEAEKITPSQTHRYEYWINEGRIQELERLLDLLRPEEIREERRQRREERMAEQKREEKQREEKQRKKEKSRTEGAGRYWAPGELFFNS